MLGTAIIIFREVLEAALIIGILSAATRNISGSRRWIIAGVLVGLAGSAALAASTDFIGALANGIGQELFMLAWHNIWMSSHGAALAMNARNLGNNINDGGKESSALFIIVAVAVLREGSESVLFLYGIAASETGGQSYMLLGGLIGALSGVLVGYGIYAGLVKLPVRWFFTATSALVLMLAASMASQAAHYLIQADLLPSLASPLWDSSAILSEQSLAGKLLHTLIGYESHPAGMQLVFYIAALVAIGLGMYLAGGKQRMTQPAKTA
jgi:high-affinity iron transporter